MNLCLSIMKTTKRLELGPRISNNVLLKNPGMELQIFEKSLIEKKTNTRFDAKNMTSNRKENLSTNYLNNTIKCEPIAAQRIYPRTSQQCNGHLISSLYGSSLVSPHKHTPLTYYSPFLSREPNSHLLTQSLNPLL